MKLKWHVAKDIRGKRCSELHEEFSIDLAIFECTKGNLVGHCPIDAPKVHWSATVGIPMGPGTHLKGHEETEPKAIEAAEKAVIKLLDWRKDYWNDMDDKIHKHMRKIGETKRWLEQ